MAIDPEQFMDRVEEFVSEAEYRPTVQQLIGELYECRLGHSYGEIQDAVRDLLRVGALKTLGDEVYLCADFFGAPEPADDEEMEM